MYGLVAILFRKRTELQLDNALKPAPSPMPSCGALFVVQQNLVPAERIRNSEVSPPLHMQPNFPLLNQRRIQNILCGPYSTIYTIKSAKELEECFFLQWYISWKS